MEILCPVQKASLPSIEEFCWNKRTGKEASENQTAAASSPPAGRATCMIGSKPPVAPRSSTIMSRPTIPSADELQAIFQSYAANGNKVIWRAHGSEHPKSLELSV